MRGRKPSVNYAIVDPKIREMYLEGASLREIGRRLYLHVETVRRRVKAMGIPIRNISELMVLHHANRKKESQ